MDVLSHPFRLTLAGKAATVPQGSDQANAELLASLTLTVRGERPYVPAYGLEDPAFGGFELADLQAGVILFCPHLTVDLADVSHPTDDSERVVVTFE